MLNCPVGATFNTRAANRTIFHVHRNGFSLIVQLENFFWANRNTFSTSLALVVINNYIYHTYHLQKKQNQTKFKLFGL